MNDYLSGPLKRGEMAPPSAFEIDADALNDVLQAIGAEEVGACVASVLADIEHLIGQLSVGGSHDVLDAVGREAHHLSGGCRSLGLVSIGAVCARIEADARKRVDHGWPDYCVELAQQRKALSDWWSIASADSRLTGTSPPE